MYTFQPQSLLSWPRLPIYCYKRICLQSAKGTWEWMTKTVCCHGNVLVTSSKPLGEGVREGGWELPWRYRDDTQCWSTLSQCEMHQNGCIFESGGVQCASKRHFYHATVLPKKTMKMGLQNAEGLEMAGWDSKWPWRRPQPLPNHSISRSQKRGSVWSAEALSSRFPLLAHSRADSGSQVLVHLRACCGATINLARLFHHRSVHF